jgi:hypothetical protein
MRSFEQIMYTVFAIMNAPVLLFFDYIFFEKNVDQKCYKIPLFQLFSPEIRLGAFIGKGAFIRANKYEATICIRQFYDSAERSRFI